MSVRAVKRALISVYDKRGLPEFAQGLHALGVEIVSTGSTAASIAAAGVPVTEVAQITGFPEILDGRVKTLHPTIHAGILADVRKPDHLAQLSEHNIAAFELVVVNLYPFAETVASGASVDECIEKIDIGGPAMVRAAAKNHLNVAVVVSPDRYGDILSALSEGGFRDEFRCELALAAFQHTASYDVAVATWLQRQLDLKAESQAETGERFVPWRAELWERAEVLRYGENPHQPAALYVRPNVPGEVPAGVAYGEQLHGKAMSYNNFVDTDAAWRAAHDFDLPAAAIIKHANPCGVAVGHDIVEAYRKAHATDPLSAFGGVIAVNREVTAALAEQISPVFTEVVAAPGFTPEAQQILQQKPSIRLLVVQDDEHRRTETRPISGGLLVQALDQIDAPGDDPQQWTLVSGEPADAATLADLAFSWRAVRAVKSNAILLAHDGAAVGIGMGQVNRLDSAKLAVERANTLAEGQERARGAVAASDAFFPFADGLQILIDAGVRAVVQPGGSKRDEEVFAAAQAAGLTMYTTGVRHFAH